MNFNINETLPQMLSAIKAETADKWPAVKDHITELMNRRKARFDIIAQMTLNNEMDGATMQMRIDDERVMLEVEMNTMKIISKAIAQNAANAALDVLKNAIQTAIKFVP